MAKPVVWCLACIRSATRGHLQCWHTNLAVLYQRHEMENLCSFCLGKKKKKKVCTPTPGSINWLYTIQGTCISNIKNMCSKTFEMAQQVSLLATNPDNLSLIPGAHLAEGQSWPHKLFSDRCTYSVACSCMCTPHIYIQFNKCGIYQAWLLSPILRSSGTEVLIVQSQSGLQNESRASLGYDTLSHINSQNTENDVIGV